MRGRCPECNLRIPPPEPLAPPIIHSSTSEVPLGLVPLDEEDWPEPAQLLPNELEQKVYTLAGSIPNVLSPQPLETSSNQIIPEQEHPIFKLADEPKPAPPKTAFDPAAEKAREIAKAKAREEEVRRKKLESQFESFLDETHGPGKSKAELRSKTKQADADHASDSSPETPILPETKAGEIDPLFLDELKTAKTEPKRRPTLDSKDSKSVDLEKPPSPLSMDPLANEVPTSNVSKAAVLDIPTYSFANTPDDQAQKTNTEAPPIARFAKEDSTLVTQPAEPEQLQASGSQATNDLQMYKLSNAELNPEKPEPVPEHLFFDGVWNLPFKTGNIGAWVWNSIGMTLIFMLMQGMAGLAANLGGSTGGNVASGLGLAGLAVALVWVVALLGSYFSMCFFNIVLDTCHRAKEIAWPDGSWREWFWGLIKFLWLLGLSIGVAYPFYWLFEGIGWALGATFAFPLVLFSSLIAQNEWFPFSATALGKIALRARFYFTLCLISGLLVAVTYGLSVLCFPYVIAAPLIGMFWAAAGMILARLMGRFGSLLYEDEMKYNKKKKKRKKRRVTTETSDAPASEHDSETESDIEPAKEKPQTRL